MSPRHSSAAPAPSIAPEEVARFSAQAAQFWDPKGPFAALHRLKPLRESYIRAQVAAHLNRAADAPDLLRGQRVLDVGCGGGLLAEPLAQWGGKVTGVDASDAVLAVAKAHAAESGLAIDYRAGSVESMAAEKGRFDIIVALEIVEHVADLESFMAALGSLLKPGGLLILSSVNRTRRSFVLGVVMAEYILNWVPAGTHDWDRFRRPSELIPLIEKEGLTPCDLRGMVFNPLKGGFVLSAHRTAVNYFLTACRKKGAAA